jgi:RNA polymerase sigma-70 factor (ECF subfamily)
MQSLTDENLVLLYQQSKDQKCMGELYSRYSSLVMGVSLKYLKNVADSQDIVMQVFEKLIKDLPKYEIQKFRPWLYQLTKNECLMKLRKEKKGRVTSMENVTISQPKENEIEEHLEKEALLVKLEEFIPQLKDNQKVCIELFFLHNKSYIEISQSTQLSLKEVKSNIQNGKRNLEIKLNNTVSVS